MTFDEVLYACDDEMDEFSEHRRLRRFARRRLRGRRRGRGSQVLGIIESHPELAFSCCP